MAVYLQTHSKIILILPLSDLAVTSNGEPVCAF